MNTYFFPNKMRFFVTLIVTLTTFTLTAQNDLSVKSFIKIEGDMTAQILAPRRDANNDKAALIKVVTPDTEFQFEAGTLGLVGTEQKVGEIWVYVSPNERKLTIKHPVFSPIRNYDFEGITIEAGAVYELRLEHAILERVIREKEVVTEWIIVDTEPSNADVYLNGEPVGKTLYQNEHPVGEYTWSVQLMNYKTQTGNLSLIKGEEAKLQLALVPDYGDVIISSTPESGMSVALDGFDREVVTPCTLRYVPSGRHKVILSDEWYETKELDIDVIEGEEIKLNVTMNPAFSRVEINAPEESEIWVNNEEKGVGAWFGRVRPGAVNIRVEKEGYKDFTKKVVLRAGEHQIINAELEPKLGKLRVITEPYGAEVFVDGQSYGLSPQTIANLKTGKRKVEIVKEGFDNQTFDVVIEEDQTVDAKRILEVSQWIEEKVVLRFGNNGVSLVKGDRALSTMEDYIRYSDVPMGDYHFLFREKLNADEREWKADLVNYRPRAAGASALKSMVLPGWGTRAVTYGKRGNGATGTFLLFGGLAAGMKAFSMHRYNQFQTTTDPGSANLYYNEANLANQVFLISGGIAATVYVVDVLRVFAWGRKIRVKTKSYRREVKTNPISIQ